jgi:thioesterase domain-containing protein
MSCTKYGDFELGRIKAAEIEKHLETCAECRRQAALDQHLTRETARLRKPIDDAGLWDRIEAELAEESRAVAAQAMERTPGRARPLLLGGFPMFARVAAVAAVALVAAGLAVWFLVFRPSPAASSGLMDDAALARVENAEREYAAAIKELEVKAAPMLARMDFPQLALYRDRLETIDAQIERCREAAAGNPWNAHVRTYMLAALRDKQDTLGRILAGN